MKNFNIKSIILGIGIGLIITSILSIIYLAGSDPSQKISDEEIVKRAEKLGMVKSSLLAGMQSTNSGQNTGASKVAENSAASPVPTPIPTPSPTPTTTPSPTPSPTQSPSPLPSPTPATYGNAVQVVVYPGESAEDVANRLVRAKLISDKEAFLSELANEGLTRDIMEGTFYITPGTDIKAIINMITYKR